MQDCLCQVMENPSDVYSLTFQLNKYPQGPSQVDITWLQAISVQSHINVVFLKLQLDSLINNSTEGGVNFHYLSQWAVNFET